MKEIPQDLIKEVDKITEKLLIYKNEKKLSWIGVYKEVLKELSIENRISDHKLLSNVVTKLTRLGYDIQDKPFKLDKFI